MKTSCNMFFNVLLLVLLPVFLIGCVETPNVSEDLCHNLTSDTCLSNINCSYEWSTSPPGSEQSIQVIGCESHSAGTTEKLLGEKVICERNNGKWSRKYGRNGVSYCDINGHDLIMEYWIDVKHLS